MEHGIEKNKTNMGMPIFVYKIKKNVVNSIFLCKFVNSKLPYFLWKNGRFVCVIY